MPLGTDARAPKRAAPAAAARTIFPPETAMTSCLHSDRIVHRDTLYGRRKDVQVSRHFYFLFYTISNKTPAILAGACPASLQKFLASSHDIPMVGPNKLRSNAHWVRSNACIYIYVYGIPIYTQRFTVCPESHS